jgi:hypothetical protein
LLLQASSMSLSSSSMSHSRTFNVMVMQHLQHPRETSSRDGRRCICRGRCQGVHVIMVRGCRGIVFSVVGIRIRIRIQSSSVCVCVCVCVRWQLGAAATYYRLDQESDPCGPHEASGGRQDHPPKEWRTVVPPCASTLIMLLLPMILLFLETTNDRGQEHVLYRNLQYQTAPDSRLVRCQYQYQYLC